MDVVLSTQDLCKKYRHTLALDHLTMQVPKGSIYGLVGRNGAGKTTLIRLICGLQAPTSGSYTLYGAQHGTSAIRQARQRMGAMVESPAIYQSLTAQDNLRMQYQVLGLPSDQDIPHLLDLVGLSHTGKKKVRHFSLGMRQRLGIAMALAGNPDFLVLDEPTNGLDPQGIVEMRELLLRLNREHQITILISSHILDELSRLATRYGFVDGGRMLRQVSAGDFTVTMTEDGVITFANSAPDFNPLLVERLFDRFFTVETARHSTGLGLSIAQQLTQRLGGSIHARYQEGQLILTLSFSS